MLAKDPSTDIRYNIVKHPNTQGYTLHVLAKDPDMHIRSGVVMHNNTQAATLDMLSEDPFEHVAYAAKKRFLNKK